MKRKFLSRISQYARIVFLLAWVPLSSIVYGILCILARIISQKLARTVSIAWCRHLSILSSVKVVTKGMEKLDMSKNYIFVANHESYYDIVVLYISLPFNMVFIARRNLFFIPVWGWALGLVGHIPVDIRKPQKAQASMKQAIHIINKKKYSIFGFPEGTRSYTGEIAEFKLGLFSLALKTGINIVPVAIKGAREVLPRGSLMLQPGTVHLYISEPVDVKQYKNTDKFMLAQRTKEIILSLLGKKRTDKNLSEEYF